MIYDSGITKFENAPFKYALIINPIDWWMFTLTKKQLRENMILDNPYGDECPIDIREIEKFIIYFVLKSWGEKPHTIRYTSIPDRDNCACSLVAIAKASRSGGTFVFSDNRKFLEMLEEWNYL